MEYQAYIGHAVSPVRKSAAAKPMIKKVVGVRNDLKGSLQIASKRRPFPKEVITDRTAKRIPNMMLS